MVALAEVAGGALLVLAGVVLIATGRSIADLSEKLDAIGSTNPIDETEAAWWKVALFRTVGVVVVLIGLVFVGAGLAG